MKNYILLYLTLLVGFSSCETEEPIPTYTLSLSVSPSEGGKITVSPQTPTYQEGEVVTLTPEPNEYWVFKQWEGDGSGSTTPLQITMTSNKSVVGVFVKRDYPLNLKIEGEGTVEEKIVTNPSGREYPHGTTVQLTPKPKEGWVFDSWSGDLTGAESPKNIMVDKEKNVTVKFKRRDYPLNITIEGEGTVEEKIVTSPSGRSYPFQTVVELKPIPKEGWVFDSWSGDLIGRESTKTITVDKEKNVTAKFKRREYPLNITIEGEGTVEERIVTNQSGRVYPFQTVVELKPIPKEGWVFESWSGDLSGTESPKTITVDKEKNFNATFQKIQNENELVKDFDGNYYKTIKIGDQIWMSENLDVSRFNNGQINEYWIQSKNGKLYYSKALFESAGGICPEGWRIPSLTDWNKLISHLGGDLNTVGALLKKQNIQNWSENLINSSGFDAIPTGYVDYRQYNDYSIKKEDQLAVFWAIEMKSGGDYSFNSFSIYYDSKELFKNEKEIGDRFSCRCIKD